MNCPRCGTPMSGGVCPECGFPINCCSVDKWKTVVVFVNEIQREDTRFFIGGSCIWNVVMI